MDLKLSKKIEKKMGFAKLWIWIYIEIKGKKKQKKLFQEIENDSVMSEWMNEWKKKNY